MIQDPGQMLKIPSPVLDKKKKKKLAEFMNCDKKKKKKSGKEKKPPSVLSSILSKKQPQRYLAQNLQKNLQGPWLRTWYKRKKDNVKKKKTDPHKEKWKQS